MGDKREPGDRTMYVVEGGKAENIVKYRRGETPPKKRKYNDGGVILGFTLFLLLIYLGGYIVNFFTKEKIPETVVVYGSIEPVMVFSGVIIRDETVYYSSADGLAVYEKNNFDKVKAQSTVCSVQDEKAVAEYMKTLNTIENNMLTAQEGRAQSSAVELEVKNLNSQIQKTVDDKALMIGAMDMTALYDVAAKAEQLVSHRNKILLENSQGSIKNMSQQRDIYQSQLQGAISQVYIGKSGIISYKTDGYEEQLSPSRLKVISKEETLISVDYGAIYTPSYVKTGDPLFKIITSSDWYIAAYLPLEQTEGWKPDTGKTLYVDKGNGIFSEMETRIYSMERIGDDIYVVFRCNKYLTNYLDCRNISFKIKKGQTEGLKIPNSAIVEKTLIKIPVECVIETENGAKQVLRLNNATGGYDKVAVSAFSADEDYVNVIMGFDNIRLGDVLAIPERINETRMLTLIENIKGVYVTNSGSAVYKRIVVSGEVYENVNYTIIVPELNPYVKVSDRIVSDARNVEEKQMIY